MAEGMGEDQIAAGACPSCGRTLTPGGRFCAHCGTPITAIHDEAERRLVTVVFLDMVGSTPIAERMDPEEFRDLVLTYQGTCVSAIESEGGYIADYRGDAVLAYFGYPVAHEDSAVRAVRASLAAIEQLKQTGSVLEMRAGIHTGLVIVGDMGAGSGWKRDVVMGDAPNVAARLQSFADSGQVVVSQDTLDLTAGRFVSDDLGTPELKGITRPIRLHRVRGEADKIAERPAQATPFVGREEEMAQLHDLFKTAAGSKGQIAIVEGEPGVGKSRLLRKFREELSATEHGWIDLAATATDSLSPLRPVIEAMRVHDSIEQAADQDDVELLRSLLGLPSRDLGLPPAIERRRTMDALAAWFLSFGRERPVVLVVEDAHWLDPTSSELIAAVDRQMVNRPVLLVLTTRGGEPVWSGSTPRTNLHLAPLAADNASNLVRSLAGGRMSEEIVADVVSRTDGVPLFIEEVSRAFIEGATDSIPASIQQSLTARLDRLGEARELAQVASVFGRDFGTDLLIAVSGRPRASLAGDLKVLEGSGLVERVPDGPNNSPVYRFRHALVRDVAYESLLRTRRKDLHAKVATAFVEFLPDLVKTQPELVAHHHAEAGSTNAAIEYWMRAAQASGDRHGLEEGVQHAMRALESLQGLDQSTERDQRELGLILVLMRLIVQSNGSGDSRMEQIFIRAGELTESSGPDAPERFSSISGLCAFYIGHGRLPEAREIALEMNASAERSGRRTFKLFAQEWLGIIEYYRGHFAAALEHLQEAHSVYRPDRDVAASEAYGFDVGVSALFHIAYLHWFLGRPEESLTFMARAREAGEQLPMGFPLCHALVSSGTLHAFRGEPDEAERYADLATEMAVENEWHIMSGQAAFAKGRALWMNGRMDEAVRVLDDALALLLQPGGFGSATLGLTWLAEALLDAGDQERAALTIARAERIASKTEERFLEAEWRRVKARVLSDADMEDEATSELDLAIEVARSQGSAPLEDSVRSQVAAKS